MVGLANKVAKSVFPGAANAGSNATGMIVLQILRACTVITLGTMCTAYWFFIIRVDKSRTYFVFECASLFFNSIICVILILSEFPPTGVFKRYLRTSWPVLSEVHGVAWLGGVMILLGCSIFGNLNKPANESKNLGASFFNLVLAAGILAILFGVLNILCSFVWRNGKEGITSRDIRADGALAKGRRQSLPDYSSSTGSSFLNEKTKTKFVSMFWNKAIGGSGGNKEKTSMPTAKPNISGPADIEKGHGEDDRRSPIVPELRRPNTAMHPINLNANSGRSSQYSDPDMSRF
ncbi:hypothetical protein NOR_04006 [Metarhizium rileyi]|uniref:DUF7598 domain-containing protein n=1 Tax=Metarhizium rileyi (strain RCEF 4871) TaxID=1649241 RepID=A0A162JH73_METRR|nr:hypothetical protein NOR_04006 [Metarhizium rileyi RCEF 4871]TWU75675.1 hypothetical protein ED733_007336 [Metarhizium rileyi]